MKKTSRTDLSIGVPYSAFWSRLMALMATFTGSFYLSKRDAIQQVRDFYGVEISEGSVINVEERVAAALKEIDGSHPQRSDDRHVCQTLR